jgi:hypothetical protein
MVRQHDLEQLPVEVPDTTRNAIWSLTPNVARTCSSKAESAVSTTTWVLLAALLIRPILMTSARLPGSGARPASRYLTGAAATLAAFAGSAIASVVIGGGGCDAKLVTGLIGRITSCLR